MTIRKQLVKREIAGDVILVPVGDASLTLQGLLTLNETGELLWARCRTRPTKLRWCTHLRRHTRWTRQRRRPTCARLWRGCVSWKFFESSYPFKKEIKVAPQCSVLVALGRDCMMRIAVRFNLKRPAPERNSMRVSERPSVRLFVSEIHLLHFWLGIHGYLYMNIYPANPSP